MAQRPCELRSGVVRYSAADPPTAAQAARLLGGIDGGDFSRGIATGGENRSCDGGDFSSGALVLWPLAKTADGGVFLP